MERWLHQHIFKVGWLLTRNSRVTTALYYTLFAPGILLHEVVSWLVAGILNVHATQSLAWPQSQEIGELRLNFVRISTNIPRWKRFVISLAPLVAGMLFTWHVAENVFQLDTIFAMMSSGSLVDVGAALGRLLATPDFWLWFYLLFTVSNTMFARTERSISNAQSLLSAVTVIVAAIVLVGVTSATFSYVSSPFENALSVLSELLVLLIAVNFVATIFLGTIESTIERFSDHSVTFRGGRMEMVTRQQLIEEREKERARAKRRAAKAAAPLKAAPITSVYKLAFPIPGGPTRESGEQLRLDIAAQVQPAERPATTRQTLKLPTSQQPKPPAKPPQLPQIPSITPIESLAEKAENAELVKPDPTPDVAEAVSAPVMSSSSPITVEEAETADASIDAPASSEPDPAAETSQEEEPILEEDDAETPTDKPAVPARPFASPFAKPTTSAFAFTEDDAETPTDKPAVPARPFASPFAKPTTSAFTFTQEDDAEKDAIASSDDLPDPLADEEPPAKPAAPRNPLYARATTTINPFGQIRPIPKTIKVDSDTEAEKTLASLLSSDDDLSYEQDTEYYSEEDDVYTSPDE
ncbi:hypothetical protein VZO05_05390 [Aggregatilineales bacterium SYSU G02658]